MIGLQHYLIVAAALFVIGTLGFLLNRKSVLIQLLSVEVLLLSVTVNFVAFSSYLGDLSGQVFAAGVVLVALAQTGVGLVIFVCFTRSQGTLDVEDVGALKG